jgi:hypothetical protein
MAKRSSGMTYIPETVNGSFDYKRNIRGSFSIKRGVKPNKNMRLQSPDRILSPEKTQF